MSRHIYHSSPGQWVTLTFDLAFRSANSSAIRWAKP